MPHTNIGFEKYENILYSDHETPSSDNSKHPLVGKISHKSDYVAPSSTALVHKDHANAMQLAYIIRHVWKIDQPGMIITVTGSAKTFKGRLNSRLKEVFRRGLVKAAKASNAIITTGGTNYGVMMHVGKAMREYSSLGDNSKPIPCIGFVSYAKFHSQQEQKQLRNDLEQQTRGEKFEPYEYERKIGEDPGMAAIDPNHNYFVMVEADTEKEKAENPRYSGWEDQLKLWAETENFLRKYSLKTDAEGNFIGKKTRRKMQIPGVLVVVQGGPGTLSTIENFVTQKTPVVLIGNTNMCADVLVDLYDAYTRTKDWEAIDVESICRKYSFLTNKIDGDGRLDLVFREKLKLIIVKNYDLIVPYIVDESQIHTKAIDVAIMDAVLKSYGQVSNENLSRWKSKSTTASPEIATPTQIPESDDETENLEHIKEVKQTELALEFSQHDWAKEHIIENSVFKFKPEEFFRILQKSLLADNDHFVDIFMSDDFNITDFVTRKRILKLYSKALGQSDADESFIRLFGFNITAGDLRT